MIQEANARAHSYLLSGRELRGVAGVFGRDDAMFGGFLVCRVGGGREGGGLFVGGEDAAVEGEGDLDFGFVGEAGDAGCSLHFFSCMWWL